MHCLDKWEVIVEKEIETFSSILYLGYRNGFPVVVKCPRPSSDESGQRAILRHFGGDGMVRVIAAGQGAMLLERLMPGHPVAELTFSGKDDEATRVFCRIVRRLHTPKTAPRHATTLEALAAGFDRHLASGNLTIPLSEVEIAKDIYRSLLSDQAAPILLHGDLHHDNILSDATPGWTAIDPKGYAGEPIYEAGAWLRNPAEYLPRLTPALLQRRVAIMVEELGWDQNRILRWSYAQAVLSILWSIEDGQEAQTTLAVAGMLKSMIQPG